MIFQQPIHAVVRPTAFFVRGEGYDDVPVWLKPFAFVLNEIGDPNGRLGLVIAGAAAVEEPILFEKLKRVGAPVFSFGLDDIDVCEQKDRFAPAGAVIANDKIAFLRNRATEKDVGVRESCGLQAGSGSFCNRSCRSG